MLRIYCLAATLFLLIFGFAAAQNGAETPSLPEKTHPPEISKIEGVFGVGWQYDRAFSHTGEMLAKGLFTLNNAYNINAGFSFNSNDYYQESTTFASGDMSLAMIPARLFSYFNFKLLYIYFDNPEYEWRVNSLIPMLVFNSSRVSASLGTHLRRTSFFGESSIQENMWAIDVVVTPLKLQRAEAGLAIANFDEFFQGGFWDFYLKLFLNYKLEDRISLDNSVTLLQSGLDGFTVSFYGIKIKSALRVTW
jgi:hypothetical protein